MLRHAAAMINSIINLKIKITNNFSHKCPIFARNQQNHFFLLNWALNEFFVKWHLFPGLKLVLKKWKLEDHDLITYKNVASSSVGTRAEGSEEFYVNFWCNLRSFQNLRNSSDSDDVFSHFFSNPTIWGISLGMFKI